MFDHNQARIIEGKAPPDRFREEVLNCKILVVEDDLVARNVLTKLFEREGFYTIEEAENGKQALEKLYSYRPDLIIADIKMPEMDGFELCHAIRRDPDPTIARLPILIQTALKQMKDKARIFEAGATDYVTKPIDPHEIATRCIVHLEREIILRRLRSFGEQMVREREPQAAVNPEALAGEYWSFKRLSATINMLLEEIERSHAELQEADAQAGKLKAEFLTNLTHELEVPVQNIVQLVQSASGDCARGNLPELKKQLSDITTNAQRLDVLISDLLDFSSITATR